MEASQTELRKYVAPHRVPPRQVTEADIPRVLSEAEEMKRHINQKYNCVGLAHTQIEDKDPLCFFVDMHHRIVINPVITRHSNYTKPSTEGCMTYLGREKIIKQRWQKLDADFFIIQDGRLIPMSEHITGFDAVIFQHETDHCNSIYCYD